MTLRRGAVAYDLNGLSSEDWRRFNYRRALSSRDRFQFNGIRLGSSPTPARSCKIVQYNCWKMLIRLSHPLSEHTPFYSCLPKPRLEQIYDLGKGDVCNSFYLTTSNHAGTHVDAPRHFCSEGRDISDYDLSELIFLHPLVLDVPLADSELIEPRHFESAPLSASLDTDIILLRSGFGQLRGDERRYVDRSPGFGPAAAEFLMDRFPRLRALAVDFMSISSPAHEIAGAEAHRIFLGCTHYRSRPILLVEDALLPDPMPLLLRVFVIPWMFDGLDSAPCTMFGEADHA
jgi:arylformamidase